jgi:phospholipase C
LRNTLAGTSLPWKSSHAARRDSGDPHAPTGHDAKGRAICAAHHAGLAGDDAVETVGDYIPHHEPFQYFTSTQNLHHVLPKDDSLIGTSLDGANHQYDLCAFWTAFGEGKLRSVTYLKPAAYQDAHPGLGPVVSQSAVSDDALVAPGNCRSSSTATQGRCGYGPRLPLLVISPYAKQNYIDHRTVDQSDPALHRGQLGPGQNRCRFHRLKGRDAQRLVRFQ